MDSLNRRIRSLFTSYRLSWDEILEKKLQLPPKSYQVTYSTKTTCLMLIMMGLAFGISGSALAEFLLPAEESLKAFFQGIPTTLFTSIFSTLYKLYSLEVTGMLILVLLIIRDTRFTYAVPIGTSVGLAMLIRTIVRAGSKQMLFFGDFCPDYSLMLCIVIYFMILWLMGYYTKNVGGALPIYGPNISVESCYIAIKLYRVLFIILYTIVTLLMIFGCLYFGYCSIIDLLSVLCFSAAILIFSRNVWIIDPRREKV